MPTRVHGHTDRQVENNAGVKILAFTQKSIIFYPASDLYSQAQSQVLPYSNYTHHAISKTLFYYSFH